MTRLLLTEHLRNTLTRELAMEWHVCNANYFCSKLKIPTLEIVDVPNILGQWISTYKTLRISWCLIESQSWGQVIEVLKHEMAHQYVDEILQIKDEQAHGYSFKQVCKQRGIDAHAQGLPQTPINNTRTDALLLKVRKLLALADSTNPNEAQTAMNLAQKLMLEHHIEYLNQTRSNDTSLYQYRFSTLGLPKQKIQASDRWMSLILQSHFFVETIWVNHYSLVHQKRGKVLEICGLPHHIDMAEYVYYFLTQHAHSLIKKNKITQKQAFLCGIFRGFKEQLDTQQKQHQEQGLICIKNTTLTIYYKKRHPHVRRYAYKSNQHSDSFYQGLQAGKNIRLHRPIKESSKQKTLVLRLDSGH